MIKMGWTAEGAAKNLARNVGTGLWPKTRKKLEDLSTCGDPNAEKIAREALEKQRKYYDRDYNYD